MVAHECQTFQIFSLTFCFYSVISDVILSCQLIITLVLFFGISSSQFFYTKKILLKESIFSWKRHDPLVSFLKPTKLLLLFDNSGGNIYHIRFITNNHAPTHLY